MNKSKLESTILVERCQKMLTKLGHISGIAVLHPNYKRNFLSYLSLAITFTFIIGASYNLHTHYSMILLVRFAIVLCAFLQILPKVVALTYDYKSFQKCYANVLEIHNRVNSSSDLMIRKRDALLKINKIVHRLMKFILGFYVFSSTVRIVSQGVSNAREKTQNEPSDFTFPLLFLFFDEFSFAGKISNNIFHAICVFLTTVLL